MDWGPPTSATIFRVRDIALTNTGSRLLAVSDGALAELDPTSLAQLLSTTNVDYFGGSWSMRYLALTNDGYALIAGEYSSSGAMPLYLYSPSTPGFTSLAHRAGSVLLGAQEQIGQVGPNGTAASGDGSRVVIVHGALQSLHYTSANGALSRTPFDFPLNSRGYRPALDSRASRLIIANGTQAHVYTSDDSPFCTLPAETQAYAVNPLGTRGYVVDSASNLQVFGLETDTNDGPCLQVGTDIAIPDVGLDQTGFNSSVVWMTMSPDGETLFIAGVNGLLVKPVPNRGTRGLTSLRLPGGEHQRSHGRCRSRGDSQRLRRQADSDAPAGLRQPKDSVRGLAQL